MRQRTVDLSDPQVARLWIEAERRGISVPELIRRFVDQGLDASGTPWPQHRQSTAPAPAEHLEGGRGENLSVSGEGGGVVPVPGKSKRSPRVLSPDPDFDAFWSQYPRKDAKKAALKAWHGSARTRPPLVELIEAVHAQTKARGWPENPTPHASTWLNGERWNDPVDRRQAERREEPVVPVERPVDPNQALESQRNELGDELAKAFRAGLFATKDEYQDLFDAAMDATLPRELETIWGELARRQREKAAREPPRDPLPVSGTLFN